MGKREEKVGGKGEGRQEGKEEARKQRKKGRGAGRVGEGGVKGWCRLSVCSPRSVDGGLPRGRGDDAKGGEASSQRCEGHVLWGTRNRCPRLPSGLLMREVPGRPWYCGTTGDNPRSSERAAVLRVRAHALL